jgi:hypothetical protein
MSAPQLYSSPDLPVNTSDQDGNIRHEQRPAESIEVPPQFRICLISGILRRITLLTLHRSSGMAAVIVNEMQNNTTAYHHVNDLGRNTSDEETATRIEECHVTAVACRRNTGNGSSGDLDQNTREVRADEDVRVPLGLEFRVLLAAVEDDVLKHHRDGGGDEGRSDEKAGELHGHCGRAVDGHVRRLLDCICWILLTSKDPDASSVGRRSL